MNKKYITMLLSVLLVTSFITSINGCSDKQTTDIKSEITKAENKSAIEKKSELKKEETLENPISPSGYGEADNYNNNINEDYSESELGNKDQNKETADPEVNTPPVVPPIQEPVETPSTPPVTQPPVATGQFMAEVEQIIFQRVNEERAKVGVAPLAYNGTMEVYGRVKSQDMGDRNYFDHQNPEGELITAQMQRDGVSYNAWGENIAYNTGTSDAYVLANTFMTNWMNSAGHRENILSTNFTGIGVGVYNSGGKVYATQEFHR